MRISGKSWLMVIVAATICSVPSTAQQNALGMQAFGSFSGGPDLINLGNLNVHLTIPILHKQGRGIPFIYDLTYDSTAVWSPVTAGSTTTWTPQTGWGWSPTNSAVGYITAPSSSSITTTCKVTPVHTYITTYHRTYSGYVDLHGVLHHVPDLFTITITGDTSCGGNTGTSGLATADDGSGYTVSIPWGVTVTSGTVTSKAGSQLTSPIGGGTATLAEDANGNEITVNAHTENFSIP
ncbi:MAG TPA: hypothetical protein VMI06_13525 [Terriglobia bacterium]|nr:hypothetical protein [Terriglobia bacterium]